MADPIRIEGLDALIDKIRNLAQFQNLARAMRIGAELVLGDLKKYPPVSRRKRNFINPKQRAAFFAKLKAGEIEVPYRRGQSPGSQNLQQRWTRRASDRGLTQTLGNNASYAQLVQGPQRQAQYHRVTGWQTTAQVLDKRRADIVRLAQQAVREDLE